MSSYADDLLSELKETVAADVAAEEARLAAELAARAAAEEEAARRADAARRAEIEARLEAERQRRRIATEVRRTPAAADEEPIIPERSAPALEARAPGIQRLAPVDPPIAAGPRHGAGFYFVVMGLPMLCLTAIAIAWLFTAPQQVAAPPADLAGSVPTPPAPILEVAGPEPSAPVADTPVSAQVGGLPADDAASKGEGAAEAEKPSKADKRTPNTARPKPAERPRGATTAGEKPGEKKPNGLTGTLFGGEDVSDMMDDQ